MQEDQALQLKYKPMPITEFWTFVPELKYPEFKKAACRIISIFGTMYLSESFYSTLKFLKSEQLPASESITEKCCHQLFTKF